MSGDAVPENIRAEICERIANGESLRTICTDEHMPAKSTVFKYLALDAEFADQYARAREAQADAIFDEILDIADNATNDWMAQNGEDDEGYRLNGDHIQRSRLRIDARKWMAGKLRPKVYGDRLAVGGDRDMDPIKTEEVGKGAAKLASVIDAIVSRTSCEPSGE